MDILTSIRDNVLYRMQYLFYVVQPSKTMFEHVDNVPRYLTQVFPLLFLLSLIEMIVRYLQKKPSINYNDTIASLCAAGLLECIKLSVRSFELLTYCFVYENFRITTLKWNSYLTWFICFLGVDLGYYTFHRLSHEINLLWAVHQVHHSFEDMNVISAVRNSALKPYTQWFAYLPLALFIPPSIFLVHLQLGELFMFWVHTEVIKNLGPLEWILNTPSHHRVHHGRNRKYIDKNYGGTLIIWDRLFGTFEAEDPKEPVAYGLVHSIESYNSFYVQFNHFGAIIRNFFKHNSFKDKLSVLLKGPGWTVGKPRLGDLNDVPLICYPVKYWSISSPIWWKICLSFTVLRSFIFYYIFARSQTTPSVQFFGVLYLVFAIMSVGFLLERKPFASYLELLRTLITVTLLHSNCQSILVQHSSFIAQVWHISYITSIFLWLLIILLFNSNKFIPYIQNITNTKIITYS